jgi:carboxypeptidase Q
MRSKILPIALAVALATACPAVRAHDASPAPAPEPAAGAAFAADDLAHAAALRDRALADNVAYELVESLTTEIGPRLAGTPADARAVAWAKAKFEALGFDRVTLEPVTFPVWRRGAESAQVLAPYPQPLAITTLGGSVGTGGPLDAEIIRFPTLDALKAAPDGSLAGKIAFVDYRMERFRDGHGYTPASAIRGGGAVEAARKGAAALLIRSVGTDDDRLPHTGMMRYADDVARIPAAALSNPDADQLARMLERGAPVRVRLDIDAGTEGTYTSYNVIGDILGRERPDEFVIVGGHLDSWDLGTGAIDDASGVGIGMAAGALIKAAGRMPRRTVRVVAWANEESGLIGGKAYAAALDEAGIDAHQLVSESDFGAGRIYALRAGVDPAAWPAIERIGTVLAPLGIVVEKDVPTAGPGPDVTPARDRGAPWAQLAQDGTDYFDWHHTANDTLDKIEPEALDQQVAAYAVLAYLAAESDVDFGRSPPKPPPGK